MWRAGGDASGEIVDAATEYWGVAFTRAADGRETATIVGPSVEPRLIDWHPGESYWGVELDVHVVWRGLDKGPLLGRMVELPVTSGWCEIANVRIRVPEYEELERFVERLAAQGILAADPDVQAALAGEAPYWSGRTMQRRFRDATGLGRKQIEQVRRARTAYALLQEGHPVAEAAAAAGYADQAHLTRSLRVLAGLTPSQILAR